MEDTSSWEMVYMDDILCHDHDAKEQGWPACAGVQYVDGQSICPRPNNTVRPHWLFGTGWPSMGLSFKPDVNVTAALSRLVLASQSKKFDVYTTDTYTLNTSNSTTMVPAMPERYHYSSSQRLAPIWVIPRMGYALTDRAENGSLMSIGVNFVLSRVIFPT